MQSISAYIANPELIDSLATDELRLLLQHYPSFHAARLLYVYGLYRRHDDQFGSELRRAALHVPDRRQLFQLIQGDNYKLTAMPQAGPADEASSAADRTQALIDSFLAGHPEATATPQRRTHATDASVDYMAYLMQASPQPVAATPVSPLHTAAAAPRTQAAGTLHPHAVDPAPSPAGTLHPHAADHAPSPADTAAPEPDTVQADTDPTADLFTETLAKIYIKQGKYAKAAEIIRRLSLTVPNKNRYFADQIRFLDKLIINQQNAEAGAAG